MTDSLRIEKLDDIPENITPNTMYIVKQGTGFDLWLTDKDGTDLLPHNGNEVKELPNNQPPT